MISGDGTHPADEGIQYHGQRIAEGIAAAVFSF